MLGIAQVILSLALSLVGLRYLGGELSRAFSRTARENDRVIRKYVRLRLLAILLITAAFEGLVFGRFYRWPAASRPAFGLLILLGFILTSYSGRRIRAIGRRGDSGTAAD